MPWKKMRLRDSDVYVRVLADGSPVAGPDGRCDVQYRAGAGQKLYRAGVRNLSEVAGVQQLIEDWPETQSSESNSEKSATSRPTSQAAPAPKLPVGAVPVIIYTDGACTGNPGPMGIGVVVMDGEKRLEISEFLGEGTNNIAELTAIQRGLEAVVDRRERPILVHADSSYAIGLLSKAWKAKANQALVAEIRALVARFPALHFVKVAGHAGVPENERCDELGRDAVATRKTVRTGSLN